MSTFKEQHEKYTADLGRQIDNAVKQAREAKDYDEYCEALIAQSELSTELADELDGWDD